MILAGLRTELWRRFREELRTWRVRPIYACVFGSAARGDGDVSSDIDLMVVHPPFPGEKRPTRRSLGNQVSDALGTALLASAEHDAPEYWEQHLDRLRERVELWTGNPLQIVDLSFREWRRPPDSTAPCCARYSATESSGHGARTGHLAHVGVLGWLGPADPDPLPRRTLAPACVQRARTSTSGSCLAETADVAMPGVAAGLAVLAGIAASDSLCATRLGEIHRSADHRAAADLLGVATADGAKLRRRSSSWSM